MRHPRRVKAIPPADQAHARGCAGAPSGAAFLAPLQSNKSAKARWLLRRRARSGRFLARRRKLPACHLSAFTNLTSRVYVGYKVMYLICKIVSHLHKQKRVTNSNGGGERWQLLLTTTL